MYSRNIINACPIIISPTSSRLRLALVHYRVLIAEVQRDRVHTVPLIRWCRVPFALEHMPQMPSAVRAYDFRPLHPERAVDVPCHGARNGVVESRPAAPRLELLFRGIERRGAGGAGVGAGGRSVLVVLAGVGRLGALLTDDAELFCFDALLVYRLDAPWHLLGVLEKHTGRQLSLPLTRALLDRVTHISGLCCAEQRSHKRYCRPRDGLQPSDRRAGTGGAEGRWDAVEGGVTESVEGA